MFVPEKLFVGWPCNSGDWERERRLRISPKLGSLVHHHPDELAEIIMHYVQVGNVDGQPDGVRLVVEQILLTQLPTTLCSEALAVFDPRQATERVYGRRLVLTLADLPKAYPFNLFKIIMTLISSFKFPKITEQVVVKKIKAITVRQSAIRHAIINRYDQLMSNVTVKTEPCHEKLPHT